MMYHNYKTLREAFSYSMKFMKPEKEKWSAEHLLDTVIAAIDDLKRKKWHFPANFTKHDDEKLVYCEKAKAALIENCQKIFKSFLIDKIFIGYGFPDIRNEERIMIPAHAWEFLELDFEKDRAICAEQGIAYYGLRILVMSELTEKERGKILNDNAAVPPEKQAAPTIHAFADDAVLNVNIVSTQPLKSTNLVQDGINQKPSANPADRTREGTTDPAPSARRKSPRNMQFIAFIKHLADYGDFDKAQPPFTSQEAIVEYNALVKGQSGLMVTVDVGQYISRLKPAMCRALDVTDLNFSRDSQGGGREKIKKILKENPFSIK
ncbi:MAG: hypothetical protein HQL96_16460 [Magnetococcales bacterium]|nr:hypothetical protein [Magnetococcales bacterium]